MLHPINPRKVFVIVAAFNEEESVIQAVIESLLTPGYSVVVVDDGSAVPLRHSIRKGPVYFLRHPVNLGQGAALQTGMEFALSQKAAYLVTFDADGQHQAADIPQLLEALHDPEKDVVLGSRFMEGASHNMSAGRKLALQIARLLNFLLTGLMLTDAHNGVRALTANAAEKIVLKENRMAHATELLIQIKKQKLRYREVPVHIAYTTYSRQKGQTMWSAFRIIFDLILFKIFK